MSSTIDNVLTRLQGVKPNGDGWTARCPVPTHGKGRGDKSPSLSIRENNGVVRFNCFAGCTTESIWGAIGIEKRELFSCRGDVSLQQRRNSATLTLAQYAEAKNLPISFLRGLGLSDIPYQGGTAVRIPYFDQANVETAVRFRLAIEKSADGENRFRWKKGAKPQLYGLWRRLKIGYVVLCEGESDCHTLWYHCIPAFGVPGATNWNEERDAPQLDDFAKIYVIVEPDQGGVAVKDWVKKSRIQDRAYLLTLNGFKDPSALHLDDQASFSSRFAEALKTAVPFSQILAVQIAAEKLEAWKHCQHLAESASILERFAEAIHARGMVGEERTGRLHYLALTTRFLPRPVSVVVKGPSSGGKSFVTEQVLQFFPESAAYCLTAMSERVLAYTEADLRNKFLVIFEAVGLSGDFASYLIRSLLSEGRIIYEVVEKTTKGLKPRRIEKDGPTGLLVTTTAVRLHPENETRLLSLHVADTQIQTRAVLLALTQEPQGQEDLPSWKALQIWIEHGEHRVAIPFSQWLAELTPPISVRLRRDFGAVLALVKAHAILHQKSRGRDKEGRILATLEDYAVVRELVSDIVSEGVGATVAPSVRETVETVRLLLESNPEVALTKVAKHLKLDKSAASRRVAVAVQQGYLENLEDRKGRPARLVLGDPLPDKVDVLPMVEALQCCSVQPGVRLIPSTLKGTTPVKNTNRAKKSQRVIEVEV